MAKGKQLFLVALGLSAALTAVNMLISFSLVGFLSGLLILVMAFGVFRGDYPLTGALGVVLMLCGAVNIGVMAVVVFGGGTVRISAGVWLICYSIAMFALGLLLRSAPVREYLRTAKPPEKKERRLPFFRGGWRDL